MAISTGDRILPVPGKMGWNFPVLTAVKGFVDKIRNR